MTESQLIRWHARLSWLVRYSVLASMGLGAMIAFLYVDQFTGYQTIMKATLWVIGGLVAVCAVAVLVLTVAAVQQMGVAGIGWVLRGPEASDT
jgi:hypothetical protein